MTLLEALFEMLGEVAGGFVEFLMGLGEAIDSWLETVWRFSKGLDA